jgi:hypothetical protein
MVNHDIQKYPFALLTGILFCNNFGVLIVAKHLYIHTPEIRRDKEGEKGEKLKAEISIYKFFSPYYK